MNGCGSDVDRPIIFQANYSHPRSTWGFPVDQWCRFMTRTVTGGNAPECEITVEYAAHDAVADQDRLCAWLHDMIQSHLLSITEVPITGWNLRARIDQCRMAPYIGSVRLALDGTVAGQSVGKFIVVNDEPPAAGFTVERRMDRMVDLAFSNGFTFLGRLLFPSELVRALGRRRISGRLVRAWHDCCREIRIGIDDAVARPSSGGLRAWRKTMLTAVISGLFFTALSVAEKLIVRPHQGDDFAAWMGCVMIGIGVFGAVSASGLLLLPSRFYQSERAGLELARCFGVKSLAGIRTVAGGLLLVSLLAAILPGVYMLHAR